VSACPQRATWKQGQAPRPQQTRAVHPYGKSLSTWTTALFEAGATIEPDAFGGSHSDDTRDGRGSSFRDGAPNTQEDGGLTVTPGQMRATARQCLAFPPPICTLALSTQSEYISKARWSKIPSKINDWRTHPQISALRPINFQSITDEAFTHVAASRPDAPVARVLPPTGCAAPRTAEQRSATRPAVRRGSCRRGRCRPAGSPA
jgi:hypothetical protein